MGVNLDASECRWKMVDGRLQPIATLREAAPKELLHSVTCNYTTGCNRNCECRRSALHCTAMCGTAMCGTAMWGTAMCSTAMCSTAMCGYCGDTGVKIEFFWRFLLAMITMGNPALAPIQIMRKPVQSPKTNVLDCNL